VRGTASDDGWGSRHLPFSDTAFTARHSVDTAHLEASDVDANEQKNRHLQTPICPG
jgi:hypothetical protein